MDDAIAQLEQALSLAKSLNKAAQTANNHHTDEATQRGRLKDALKDLKEAGLIQTACTPPMKTSISSAVTIPTSAPVKA